ncbi:MAG: DUF5348 domain-containing protein [Oscillospiraceae bacterium]|nr:DUF5348 domain-containing protein [Oscillospiraceae bacterium]
MTILDVFDRLRPICQAARLLLEDTGYLSDGGMLTYDVRPLPDCCEDAFFRDKVGEILGQLSDISRTLCYLEKPSHGEHTLRLLPNGRYGYPGPNDLVREFTCGERLEAKIRDREGTMQWILAAVEHDGAGYFLTGFRGIALDGLTVRERW